jgi:hypothetical protein
MQSGMTPSSNDRMRNSLGGGGVLESLAGMFRGASGGRSEGPLSGLGGGGSAGGLGASIRRSLNALERPSVYSPREDIRGRPNF